MRARDNPFATHRVLQVRFEPLDDTWETLLSRLDKMNFRAAIVGPEGSGKTTMLEDLEPHLIQRGFCPKMLRLNRQQPGFPPGVLSEFYSGLNARDVILLDGAEQLSRFAWSRFRRRSKKASGLIVTAHREGLLPTLTKCRTTIDLLQNIVARLTDESSHSSVDLQRMFSRHDGNVRDCLRELYDCYSANVPTM